MIDFNYNSVREKVDKSKEQEKIDITDYLKEMTEEEREIENIFKTNKLEKWSKGIQKGFRTYQGETYDQEREQMEAKAVLDRKLEKKKLCYGIKQRYIPYGSAGRRGACK